MDAGEEGREGRGEVGDGWSGGSRKGSKGGDTIDLHLFTAIGSGGRRRRGANVTTVGGEDLEGLGLLVEAAGEDVGVEGGDEEVFECGDIGEGEGAEEGRVRDALRKGRKRKVNGYPVQCFETEVGKDERRTLLCVASERIVSCFSFVSCSGDKVG